MEIIVGERREQKRQILEEYKENAATRDEDLPTRGKKRDAITEDIPKEDSIYPDLEK